MLRKKIFLEEFKRREGEKKQEVEEKGKAIKDYIKNYYINESSRISKEEQNLFLEILEKNPLELEKILGENFNVIFDVITAVNNLEKEIVKAGINKKEAQGFRGGDLESRLPLRIKIAFLKLDFIFEDLRNFLKIAMETEKSGISISQVHKDEFLKSFKKRHEEINTEIKKWQKYSPIDVEKKEEKPIIITGFEKFNHPKISGNEIVEICWRTILPFGTFPADVEIIEYLDKIEKIGEEIIKTAEFISPTEKEGGKIIFYGGWRERKNFLENLPFILAHEFGHSIDPRLGELIRIPISKQFEIVKKWEEIRQKEPIRALPMYPPDNLSQSVEDFADAVGRMLTNPDDLWRKTPERFKFIKDLFQNIFSQFNPEDQLKKINQYRNFISSLEE